MVSSWQLEGHHGRLLIDGSSAVLDLLHPELGLSPLSGAMGGRAASCFLQLRDPALSDDPAHVEAYVRGSDLVATYAQTAARPFRVQVYWRHIPLPQLPLAIEMILSVQTTLLDSLPGVVVGSRLAGCSIMQLANIGRDEFLPANLGGSADQLEPTALCCLLARSPDGELTYAEMVHPLAERETRLSAIPAEESTEKSVAVETRHLLFRQTLEKGVILRARVLGAWLPKTDDSALAARLYREFAASEPPLTT